MQAYVLLIIDKTRIYFPGGQLGENIKKYPCVCILPPEFKAFVDIHKQ